jgi:hypothetical protein
MSMTLEVSAWISPGNNQCGRMVNHKLELVTPNPIERACYIHGWLDGCEDHVAKLYFRCFNRSHDRIVNRVSELPR